MSEENHRVTLRITGRVQGVFYRASTMEQARLLGLRGWVRNLMDGSVEAVAEGSRPPLEALVRWCQQGPTFARVEDVQVSWEAATGEFSDFRVKR